MVTDAAISGDSSPRSVGGHVSLDLVNTAVFAQGDPAADVLESAARFLAWCADNGVPVPDPPRPGDEEALTSQATLLRTALRTVVEAVAAGTAPPADALVAVRTAYVDAVAGSEPVLDEGRLRWQPADSPVGYLAVAAVDLLRDGRADRIKTCPSCGFVFLDTTKNGGRRWCSMEECGKEEKMRRYVAKRAQARGRR